MGAEDSETVKEKESEIDIKQKEKNKDTDCLGKIPIGLRILKQRTEGVIVETEIIY